MSTVSKKITNNALMLTALFISFLPINACAWKSTVKRPLPITEKPTTKPDPLSLTQREILTKTAQTFIGKSSIRVGKTSFRNDCSGAIRAIFAAAKLRLGGIIKFTSDNDVKTIYRYTQKYGHILKNNPLPGDLVFFNNTYDRSRNGRFNDALTHIGLVEKVEGDTVFFIHHLGRSIIRSRMNLILPKASYDPRSNQRINHILRRAQGVHPAYTAAELFAGFGRL